ncbi:monofunctional biosynthetic peptidoglycan transglycosylase [Arsenicitalea aurantiaca]|uniref:Biosynthetic peptidoglycan transglycosylase n=1 Tax=Arsenicitalea aurantiaca TaxID=1783274 RepID=A0A433X5T1_9HYPH|nr:transglycosylase domain-containing protein [Arsenicitalea aurantiaca]RUT29397.1 monofunctional biosynthetic peptidoglycan transglycosylase [Arsenicitalea aurantiaca]
MSDTLTPSGKAPRRRRGRKLRLLRALGLILGAIVAIPLVLVPVYGFVPPVSVPMLERHLTGRPVVRVWRDIEEVSDRLKAAVIMSEDGQFCRHHGVDLSALRTEIDNFLAGRDTRGASTLTMQVARNLFLTNSRSAVRKALEVPLALYIDLVLSKKRIMEIYLNIAEWGPEGQFGVVAGAEAAFGVVPDALSWERASLLAVTLPNPLVRRPGRPGPGLRRVASVIEARTRQFGTRAGCVAPGRALAL